MHFNYSYQIDPNPNLVSLDKVKLYLGVAGYWPKKMKIQVSIDKETWTDIEGSEVVVASVIDETNLNNLLTFDAIGYTAKYVRMYIIEEGMSWIVLREFEVYKSLIVDERTISVSVNNSEMGSAYIGEEGTTSIFIEMDIEGDATLVQKPGVKVVINGNNKNYKGMITVDGKSATYTTAGLTINNLTFNAESINGDSCMRLGNGTDATRYTCNVTVNNCKFDVPGAVGVKSYTGGDKNLTISECIATSNAHSLVQVKGHNKVLVDNCTINSKNGMNFNNSVKVNINECNADVKSYAARFGAGSAADTAVETYAITNSTLKSACEDGEAVIILRGTAANSTLTLTNTTLDGDPEITNNTNAQVIR